MTGGTLSVHAGHRIDPDQPAVQPQREHRPGDHAGDHRHHVAAQRAGPVGHAVQPVALAQPDDQRQRAQDRKAPNSTTSCSRPLASRWPEAHATTPNSIGWPSTCLTWLRGTYAAATSTKATRVNSALTWSSARG